MKKNIYLFFIFLLSLGGCELFSPSVSFNSGSEVRFRDGFVRENLTYRLYDEESVSFHTDGQFFFTNYSYESTNEDYDYDGVTNEGLVMGSGSATGTYSYDPETRILTMEFSRYYLLDTDTNLGRWIDMTNNMQWVSDVRETAVFLEHQFFDFHFLNSKVFVKGEDQGLKQVYEYTYGNSNQNRLTQETYWVNAKMNTFERVYEYLWLSNGGYSDYYACYRTAYEGDVLLPSGVSFREGQSGFVVLEYEDYSYSDYDEDNGWTSYLPTGIDGTVDEIFSHCGDFVIFGASSVIMRNEEEEMDEAL